MVRPRRHCERSEAIQSLSADAFLDCFAALAMTEIVVMIAQQNQACHSGARRSREPGIHLVAHSEARWIPGSTLRVAPE
jgi:hypothetical protein